MDNTKNNKNNSNKKSMYISIGITVIMLIIIGVLILNMINNNNQDEENPGESGNIADGQYMISGLAWFDENGNGRKDDNETTLPRQNL